jgi:hypothetical protein
VNVVGTYQLRTVNGAALPFVLTQTVSSKLELLSETISLNGDGTFSDLLSYRATSGVTQTTSSAAAIGVYLSSSGAVQMAYTSGATGTQSGSVNGNSLTLNRS